MISPEALQALIAVCCFSLGSLTWLHLKSRVTPLWINTFKASIATLSFMVATLVESWGGMGPTTIPVASILAFLISGFIGLNLSDLFMLRAITSIGPARTYMVYRFQPILIAAGAYFWFGQEVTVRQVFAVLLMIGCVLILAHERYRESKRWDLSGIANAAIGMTLDGFGILITRYGFEEAPAMSVFQGNFVRCLGAMIGFFVISQYVRIGFKSHWEKMRSTERAQAVLTSFLAGFLGLFLWLKAISHGHVASVAAIGGIGPVISVFLEAIYYRKPPSLHALAALATSLLGFALLAG